MSTYDAGRQRSDTPPAQTRPDTPEYTAARPAAPERRHPDDVLFEQAVRTYPALALGEAYEELAGAVREWHRQEVAT